MHPRNIYNKPPNFAQLAAKYPEFAKVSSVDLNGTVRIDFKDLNAIRALTKCLLHSDFDLNVDIPLDRLIPTVPLRLNYLLWVEDLLNSMGKAKDVIGIDIGTGACCVYPLIAAKKFNWRMLGTDIDEKNFAMAQHNVQQNSLSDMITVKMVSSNENLLLHCFTQFGGTLENADFCMCNPPFYSSVDDIDCARSPTRAPPRNARSGSVHEIVTEGGEEHFVRRIIIDSLKLQNHIKIYTTMLGHKNSLKPMMDTLEAYGISNITHTTFRQGKTTRWGLAWSFENSINFPSGSSSPNKKTGNRPLNFIVPPIEGLEYDVKNISAKIVQILHAISVKTKIVQQNSSSTTMEISAVRNSWSHQRRKRREIKLKRKHNGNGEKSGCAEKDEKLDEIPSKKAKLELEGVPKATDLATKSDLVVDKINNNQCDDENYLTAALCIRNDEQGLLFQLGYLSGRGGRDSVHQIVQYIKNNWK